MSRYNAFRGAAAQASTYRGLSKSLRPIRGFSRLTRLIHALAFAALVAALTPGARAVAATYVWNGSSGTAWSAGADWWGGAVPPAGSVAMFTSASYTNKPFTGTTPESVGAIWDIGTAALSIGGSAAGALTLTGTTAGFPNTGIELDGGAGALTISGSLILGTASGGTQQWINNSANALTISSSISGGAGSTLVKGGSGLITLSNTSSYTASIIVSSGTLQANNNSNTTSGTGSGGTSLGNITTATRTITVNNGGVLQFINSNVTGSGGSPVATPFVINSGGLLTASGSVNNNLGPVTLSGGTLSGGAGGASGKYLTWQLSGGSVVVNTAPSVITDYAPVTGSGAYEPGYNMAATTTFNVGLTGTAGTVSANPDLTVSALLGDQWGNVQGTGALPLPRWSRRARGRCCSPLPTAIRARPPSTPERSCWATPRPSARARLSSAPAR